jgi:ferritin
MLNEKMLDALNDQITKELYSSYLYLQMAAWLDDHSLPGMATWMKVQAQEEIAHAMIFYNYVSERNGFVDLGAIDKPPASFESVTDVFETTLEHEQKVTASINNLMDIALEIKDYATQNRLEWFIGEQVEEEANAHDILGQLELIGGGHALFMIDKELGARTFVPPSPLAGAQA